MIFNSLSLNNCQTVGLPGMINIRETVVDNIANSSFVKSQLLVIIFANSQLKSSTGNTFSAMNKGIQFINNSTGMVANSVFVKMVQNITEGSVYQSKLSSDGSAIEIVDSHVKIHNCTFSDNVARNGGAIAIDCNYKIPCTNEIINNTFKGNNATSNGGAITYNSYAPTLSGNIFKNNSAIYGNDVANYPVKIRKYNGSTLEDITELTNVPSGDELEAPIPLAIVDVSLTQIVSSVNSGSMQLTALDKGALVSGANAAAIVNGKATFSHTILRASPGKTNVKFKLSATPINYKVVQYLNPEAYADQIITVNFRW